MILTKIITLFVFICDGCGKTEEKLESTLPGEAPGGFYGGYTIPWKVSGVRVDGTHLVARELLCPSCQHLRENEDRVRRERAAEGG